MEEYLKRIAVAVEKAANMFEIIAATTVYTEELQQPKCSHPHDRRKVISKMGQPPKWRCLDCGEEIEGDPRQ